MTHPRPATALLYPICFLSGAAALGYQMVWTKLFAAGLGHEMPSMLAVVAAFMGGMALGATSLDGILTRGANPGLCYAGLEWIIGGWGIITAIVIPFVNERAIQFIGLEPSAWRHWFVAFALPFVTLLPATAAMGATFPAMERWLATTATPCRCVGAVYAANTFGAVAGVLGTVFVLAPALGFRHSTWLLAGINLMCGTAAFWGKHASGRRTPGVVAGQEAGACSLTERSQVVVRYPGSYLRLAATLFCCGLLGIGYEIVGTRALAKVLENTIYTFAAVLSVYLLGTALGAALYQRFARQANFDGLLAVLLGGTALTCLLGLFALAQAQILYDCLRAAWGDAQPAVLAAEMAVAMSVFGLPTVFMGAAFSHLVQAAGARPGGVGRAVAWNTLGGAGAGALFGVWLLPWLGSKWTLTLISLGYLGWVRKLSGWRWAIPFAALVLAFLLPDDFRLAQLPPRELIIAYREGTMASVTVVEDAPGQRMLRVNNRFQMGGTASAPAEYRHAHLPLLLHPAPGRALFLGLGTGITLGAASRHPDLQTDAVELLPEVIAVMPNFEPHNFSPTRDPRVKVFVADARRFVRATAARYDVIVADLFHPAMDGAGTLYTVEHFRAIRARLAPGGLFCQWLPLHQLDHEMLRVIARTFLDVFPEAQAWLLHLNVDAPVIGIVGTLKPGQYASGWVESRLTNATLAAELKKLALADSVRLFGSLLAGAAALEEFAAGAPTNTDDASQVIFGAPRFIYRKGESAYGRLLTMLALGPVDFRGALALGDAPGAVELVARLERYAAARDVYLKGLIAEAEGRGDEAVDAYVESARLSGDFTAGYAQCLTRATIQATAQPDAARALLRRLIEAQPARPVARELLQRLLGE